LGLRLGSVKPPCPPGVVARANGENDKKDKQHYQKPIGNVAVASGSQVSPRATEFRITLLPLNN
jgi:hypothetical protein